MVLIAVFCYNIKNDAPGATVTKLVKCTFLLRIILLKFFTQIVSNRMFREIVIFECHYFKLFQIFYMCSTLTKTEKLQNKHDILSHLPVESSLTNNLPI